MNRIVVFEYPKSGGNWLVNLIGDALSLPKRDIYVDDINRTFDVTNHPWYTGSKSWNLTDSCVIKSHELPASPMHKFPAKNIHLIRDGRDVVVSKYFYEKEYCVQNNILKEFNTPFDEYVENISTEWSNYISAWIDKDIIVCRYEELLNDAFATLTRILYSLGEDVGIKKISESIQANTREKMKASLDKFMKYNTFIRKGIAGDWRNHFSQHNKEIFKRCAGDMLIRLGYETGNNW